MRPDDITIEVRGRALDGSGTLLDRQGIITSQSVRMKANIRWCDVGDWELSLPGNHPMVPYLSQDGSGIVVSGPIGETLSPTEYSPWSVVSTNHNTNPNFVANAAWSLPGTTGTWVGDGLVQITDSTFSGQLLPYESLPIPAAEGEVWTVSREFYVPPTSSEVRLWLSVIPYIGSASQGPFAYSPEVTIRPGETVRLAATHPGLPAGATGIRAIPYLRAAGSGRTLGMRAAMAEPTPGPTGYFDGGTVAPDHLTRYAWTGPANGSTSTRETRAVTRQPSRTPVIGTMFSGPTIKPHRRRDQVNPDGTLTFRGVTDDIHLADARAFPQPSNANPATQAVTNDVRSAPAETLMHQYVAANIMPGVAPAGRVRGVRALMAPATDLGRGSVTQRSPRFDTLLELLQGIAVWTLGTATPLGFRMVQVGGALQFQVHQVTDRSDSVRLDIENGTLAAEEVERTGPSVTYAIVAGGGEGTDRVIRVVTTAEATAAETAWGRVPERFIDQRQTIVTTELDAAGAEALAAGGGTTTAVKVIPADSMTMSYGLHWLQGDIVGVTVDGQPTTAPVTAAAIVMDDKAVMIGAAIGNVTGFSADDALVARVDAVERRTGNLERNAEAGTWQEALAVTAPLVLAGGNALSISAATDAARGAVELATSAETATGTDATRAVTPAGLLGRTATDTRIGLVELATTAEATTGTDTARAVTPAGLAAGVAANGGMRYVQTVKFTASGTFTKATYPWLKAVRVRVQAAGGAGGGAVAAGSGAHSAGGGGGGGGYAEATILASALAASTTVTVGAGGTGVAGGTGNTGGSSSFGAHAAASGGEGGSSMSASALMIGAIPGYGGEGTAGDVLCVGQPGQMGSGNATLGHGGAGGPSVMGGGGRGTYTGAGGGSQTGLVGGNYGGGGGGAMTNAGAASNYSGGAGAPGIVLVDLYA